MMFSYKDSGSDYDFEEAGLDSRLDYITIKTNKNEQFKILTNNKTIATNTKN